MERLHSFVRFDLERTGADRPFAEVPSALRAELRRRLVQEYQAFLDHHAGTRRDAGPDDPSWAYLTEDERALRRQQRAEAMAREPLWGPYMERLWRKRIDDLGAIR